MKKIFLLLFASLLLFGACSDNDDDTTPDPIAKNEAYPVHLLLNTDFGESDGILSVKNTTKIISKARMSTDTLGYKGILMYNNGDGQLSAFDIACPYCWNGNLLTATGNPDNSFECKICGLDADLDYGKGYFWNEDGKISKSLYLVKYKITKLDKWIYLVTNPSK